VPNLYVPFFVQNCDTSIAETSGEWVTVTVYGLLTSVQELECQMYYVTGSE